MTGYTYVRASYAEIFKIQTFFLFGQTRQVWRVRTSNVPAVPLL